jgi:glucan biosynthesis protein C
MLIAGGFARVATAFVVHYMPPLSGTRFVAGLIDPDMLLNNLPFFVVGMWLFRHEQILKAFARLSIMSPIFALLAFCLCHLPAFEPAPFHKALEIFRWGMLQWLGCHLCFCVFRLTLDRPSAFFRYFSDASYTIYLFHHITIIAVAALLLDTSWPAAAKFSIVLAVSLLVTFLIHEYLIRRSPLFSLLFNGKSFPQTATKATEPRAGAQVQNTAVKFHDSTIEPPAVTDDRVMVSCPDQPTMRFLQPHLRCEILTSPISTAVE